jgi:diacylglycerol kinase (ATP)
VDLQTRLPSQDKPLVVIFNKRALAALALRHSGMHEALRERRLPHEIIDTASAEESRQAAENAARAGRIVVAAGGDGTARDVANGVLAAADPAAAMGLVPLGTGNDLARSLGRIGHGLDRALDALQDGRVVCIDVGQVNGGEYFVNSLGIGFDAEVVRRRAAHRFKPPSYFPGAVRLVFSYRPQRYRVRWRDGERKGPATLVAAMNGAYEGGGVHLAPKASLEDGLLELYWIDPITPGRFARYIWAVRWGTHGGLQMVHYARAESLTVESEAAIGYHVDGEWRLAEQGTALEIVVHRQRLPMLV